MVGQTEVTTPIKGGAIGPRQIYVVDKVKKISISIFQKFVPAKFQPNLMILSREKSCCSQWVGGIHTDREVLWLSNFHFQPKTKNSKAADFFMDEFQMGFEWRKIGTCFLMVNEIARLGTNLAILKPYTILWRQFPQQ